MEVLNAGERLSFWRCSTAAVGCADFTDEAAVPLRYPAGIPPWSYVYPKIHLHTDRDVKPGSAVKNRVVLACPGKACRL